MKFISKNETEFMAIAQGLARLLVAGDVVALEGDLGAGKTTLAKAIGRTLGVEGYMTSPTYNIINMYTSDLGTLYHADVYRVEAVEALDDIGFFDHMHSSSLMIIEWADQFKEEINMETSQLIWIEIKTLADGMRELHITHYNDLISEVDYETTSI